MNTSPQRRRGRRGLPTGAISAMYRGHREAEPDADAGGDPADEEEGVGGGEGHAEGPREEEEGGRQQGHAAPCDSPTEHRARGTERMKRGADTRTGVQIGLHVAHMSCGVSKAVALRCGDAPTASARRPAARAPRRDTRLRLPTKNSCWKWDSPKLCAMYSRAPLVMPMSAHRNEEGGDHGHNARQLQVHAVHQDRQTGRRIPHSGAEGAMQGLRGGHMASHGRW